jgi:NAD(P)-dependent dehydrogenase (short-subunit alcohol dehydrogenase family)
MNDTTTMRGKVCLITGANAGLGKATALSLAKQGATVILACRDAAKGNAALAEVEAASGSDRAALLVIDLSVQQSVRDAAAAVLQKFDRLDALINNAAVFKSKRVVTSDGLETMFATNHLGHFLLTTLLLDRLKASVPARILHITAPSTVKLNFDDLQGERKFSGLWAFGASKMCNLLFSFALARRLDGTGVTSNALHPGLVKSTLMSESPFVMRTAVNLFSAPPERAAEAVTYAATSPDLANVTGKFLKGRQQITPDPYALDEQVQERLWEVSEKLVGVAQSM